MFRLKNKKQRENSLIVMRAISRIKKYEMSENSSHGLYNCLLYTSPSPRDRTRSRMPSSA